MSENESKKICFVVTPIGGDDQPIRRHIDGIIDEAITPALEEKFIIQVAHRMYDIGSINNKIISSVFNADLVIANLTSLNPNVMFELAIRYCFGKPAIVIAEKGTRLPFDVIDENTVFYINDPKGAADLRDSIIKFESGIDYDRSDYGSIYSAIGKIAVYNRIESDIKKEEVTTNDLIEFMKEKFDDLEKVANKSTLDNAQQSLLMKREYRIIVKFDTIMLSSEKKSDIIFDLQDLNKYGLKIEMRDVGFFNEGIQLNVYSKPSVELIRSIKEVLGFILEKNNVINYTIC